MNHFFLSILTHLTLLLLLIWLLEWSLRENHWEYCRYFTVFLLQIICEGPFVNQPAFDMLFFTSIFWHRLWSHLRRNVMAKIRSKSTKHLNNKTKTKTKIRNQIPTPLNLVKRSAITQPYSSIKSKGIEQWDI